LQPTTNKRNAALIQKHMEEAIGVAPSRGSVRFVPAAEENIACSGKTVAGEIDDLERADSGKSDDGQATTVGRSKSGRKLGAKSFGTLRAQFSGDLTPPASASEHEEGAVSQLPTIPEGKSTAREKKARRTKSFVATMFRRSGAKAESLLK